MDDCRTFNPQTSIFSQNEIHVTISRRLEALGIPPEQLELDVILNSAGGHPHVAYKLAKILRARASKIRFFIVQYAKSAATLIALSGDEILMGVDSELGPLDMQMEHPHLEGTGMLSAIEAIEPVKYFSQVTQQLLQQLAEKIRGEWAMSRRDALTLAIQHADSVFAPVLAKIEPSAVSLASRQLEVTRRYAEDLLVRYHRSNVAPQANQELARKLVWAYPDHGFVIWRDAARDLGLNVRPAEDDPLWPFVQRAYQACGGLFGAVHELFPVEQFKKRFPPLQGPIQHPPGGVPGP